MSLGVLQCIWMCYSIFGLKFGSDGSSVVIMYIWVCYSVFGCVLVYFFEH